MTIAYFDCFAGISGDMTLGALLDAGADRALLDATVEALRLGDEVRIEVRHEQRGHAGGTRGIVQTHDFVERTLPSLRAVVAGAEIPDGVKLPALGALELPGNALAVWIGEEMSSQTGVTVIETNIDDMAPNLIAALSEDLMAAGALDVTVLPAVMKKGRPGHLLAIMASPDTVALLTDHLLRHSTTFGVRITKADRVIAHRRMIEVRSEFGVARVKVKELGGKPIDVAPEYEDCRLLAQKSGSDLRAVMRAVAEAARVELGFSWIRF